MQRILGIGLGMLPPLVVGAFHYRRWLARQGVSRPTHEQREASQKVGLGAIIAGFTAVAGVSLKTPSPPGSLLRWAVAGALFGSILSAGMFVVALWARRAIGDGFNDALSVPAKQKELPTPLRVRLYAAITIVMLAALLASTIVARA